MVHCVVNYWQVHCCPLLTMIKTSLKLAYICEIYSENARFPIVWKSVYFYNENKLAFTSNFLRCNRQSHYVTWLLSLVSRLLLCVLHRCPDFRRTTRKDLPFAVLEIRRYEDSCREEIRWKDFRNILQESCCLTAYESVTKIYMLRGKSRILAVILLYFFQKQTAAVSEFYFRFRFDLIIIIGMSFYISLRNLFSVELRTAGLWPHIDLSRWRPQSRRYTSGLWLVTTLEKFEVYLRSKFR